MVASAVQKGIVVVAAAGNYDSDACDYSPASEPTVITVGAIDKFDKRSMHPEACPPWWSNYGPCVDVYAPGSFIISASKDSTTGSKQKSGTSMATPRKFFSPF